MDTDLIKKLDPFFHEYKPISYKKGEIIVRPEEEIENVYLIEKGFVRFYSITEDGKEMTFLIYKPGYIFPVYFAFLGGKTKYYFESLTPVVLRKAPRKVFTNHISKDSESVFSISKEIVIRMIELFNRMEFLALGNASKNVAFIILLFASEFGRKSKKSVIINLPIGHKIIASMAGLARETVSLEMKKMEDTGLISYRRNYISIKNIQKFKKEAGLYF
ncbi:MAG TPA: Crp/Fnr family transcriptional regulator [Candidatus Sulfotelmatobacter sp.]|nr:Crp/Fnr family transcriptional regulator [Candidatus Sulfotelmatobacter sp.]